ncbi:MAG: M48 family metalloprotease [Paracoccaceae bacterium]
MRAILSYHLTVLALCLTVITASLTPARATTLIRDADIEYALQKLAAPILAAAGLPRSTRVLIISDRTLNAFVLDRGHIFIHSGLLLRMKTPAMLQSVIAHEAAHIANGHMTRRHANMARANTISGLGMALAVAAAAAGANPQAAGAASLGIAGSAQRVFFAHTRAEESAADAAGIGYMARAGADPKAFEEVLNIFRGQEVLAETRQDPYARTHPLSRDRLRAVQSRAATAKPGKPDPQAAYWYARATGKLSAYLNAPSWTFTRTGRKLANDDITLMRQAVAFHRASDTRNARAAAAKLVQLRPGDPFVHDLHGQILLETRDAPAAARAYKRAASLAPDNALVLAGYGRALLAAGNPRAALPVLEKSRARDFRNAAVLRDLGTAYAKSGQNGMASLVTAERYALRGDMKTAHTHATRALGLLPRGAPSWRRAEDVQIAAQAALKNLKRRK